MERDEVLGFLSYLFLLLLSMRNPVQSQNFKLTILHTNDIHATFEPEGNRSRGGIGRVMAYIEEKRRTTDHPLIYLDAGDMFTGSDWFSSAGWKIAGFFMKHLNPDAICVGNHEFDRGVTELAAYVKRIEQPLLCANCDISKEPSLKDKIIPSTILHISGTKIGIIGYLAVDSRTTDKYFGKVKLVNETRPIRREVEWLKEAGAELLIVLSHGGLDNDIEVAKKTKDISIIIGGHSHSLLYSGQFAEFKNMSAGPYPTIVKNLEGKNVYIVQVFERALFVGKMTIVFDTQTRAVKHFAGHAQLMHRKIRIHPDARRILKFYKPEVDNIRNEVVGKALVPLEGYWSSCRFRECNLGNMITDSLIHFKARKFSHPSFWTDHSIAVINSGVIRHSILPKKENDYSITYSDVRKALPYDNSLVTVTLGGRVIWKMLEHAISWSNTSHKGEFLQFSGLRVVYDFSKPTGERVVSVRVRCARCPVPKYYNLNLKVQYKILTLDFLAQGGDGFKMLKHQRILRNLDDETDFSVLLDYMRLHQMFAPIVDERIIVLNDNRTAFSEMESVVKAKKWKRR